MGIVLIVVILILYVSYQFGRQQASFTCPVLFLRTAMSFFITLLFIPILDYYFSILNCITVSGQQVHYLFPDQQCWVSFHILHSSIAIIMALIFCVICLITVLTFYECRSISNDPTARYSSRSHFIFLVYQIVMIICLTFMSGNT